MSNIHGLPLGDFAASKEEPKDHFPSPGENPSGLRPCGRAVLVKPYYVSDRSKGGIILPADVIQKNQVLENRVVVIEIGAYSWVGEPGPRCEVGDCVLIGKWAGYNAVGPADGEQYRIINDNDIFTVITKE